MKDTDKSREQLIDELNEARRLLSTLQHAETARKEAEEKLARREQELKEIHANLETEIEERKQIGYELLKSKVNIQTLLDAIPDSLFRIHRDGTYLAYKGINSETLLNPNEFVGKTVYDLLPKAAAEQMTAGLNRALETEELQRFEYEHPSPDGTRCYEVRLVVNGVDEVLAIVRDITESKRAEENLRESEERYRDLYENNPHMVFTVAADGTMLSVNDFGARQLGYTVEELAGANLSLLFHEEDRHAALRRIAECLELGSKVSQWETRIVRKDGQRIWVKETARAIKSRHSAPAILIVCEDITWRKQADDALRESEEKFSKAVNLSPHGISIISRKDGRYLYINDIALAATGYRREEVIGRTIFDVEIWATEKEREKTLRLFSKNLSTRDLQLQVKNRAGGIYYALISSEPITIGGEPCLLITGNNITERVRAEQALRESEERYQSLANNSPVGIYRLNNEGQCVYINDRWCEIVGLPPEQGYGSGWRNAIHPGDFQEVITKARAAAAKSSNFREEYRILRPDGVVVWVYNQAGPEKNVDGEVIGYVGTLTDITERKIAEEAIKESEARFHNLAKSSPAGIFRSDVKGQCLYVNERWSEITGLSQGEALGFEWMQTVHPGDRERVNNLAVQAAKKGLEIQAEHRFLRPDGSTVWVYGQAVPERNAEGEIVGFVGTVTDITERKQAEDNLAAEKERLAVTLRSIGDGVIATDTEGKIVLLNRVAENLTGWKQEEAIGRPLTEVFHIINEKTRERSENPVEKALRTGQNVSLANHTALIARDGTERPIADSGAPIYDRESKIIGVVLVFRDMTEDLQLEAERLRAGKLESIGLLAGGIAHDFNNILTAILGNVSLAKRYIGEDHAAYRRLHETEQATMRAKDLTQQLLTFARGGIPIRRPASIGDLLREAVPFALTGSSIQSRLQIPDRLWLSEIDEGQINQVIHNLILNARQAMPTGGTIEVEAENILFLERTKIQGASLPPGRYVKVSVRDSGVGIAEEHLSKIFDPYFTTKQKGSGLGLATSYSIIKNHDGFIFVESKLGAGTTFDIYLPASEAQALEEDEVEENSLSGKGKILVMDDEEAIREMVSEMLSYLGYEAEIAKNGEEAIRLYTVAQQAGQPFDAVIMDLTIPGAMGGQEAVKKLLEIDPQARCIVSSGYSTAPVMADYKTYGFVAVIAKPFQIFQLNELLHRLLREDTGNRI